MINNFSTILILKKAAQRSFHSIFEYQPREFVSKDPRPCYHGSGIPVDRKICALIPVSLDSLRSPREYKSRTWFTSRVETIPRTLPRQRSTPGQSNYPKSRNGIRRSTGQVSPYRSSSYIRRINDFSLIDWFVQITSGLDRELKSATTRSHAHTPIQPHVQPVLPTLFSRTTPLSMFQSFFVSLSFDLIIYPVSRMFRHWFICLNGVLD